MSQPPHKDASPAEPGLKLPLVSVVVVCFNHAQFLKACLDSVVAQTYPHIQLVVVDNASTDNSRDVIRRFGEEVVSVRPDIDFETAFPEENGHEMGAILHGFPRTEGSYVSFIDGDDLLLPGFIETHVKAHLVSRIAVGVTSVDMYQSSGDDIVVGTGPLVSAFVMTRRGQTRDLCRMSNLDAFEFPASTAVSLAPDDLHYVPPVTANEWVWSPSTGLCFRREALALLLNPAPRIRAGADNYLVRGITALTGGISIDKAMAVYRLHGNNMFTKHPALANLNAFDLGQRGDLDLGVMGALVDCFRANLDDLAKSLEDPDLYIKAIDHFASIVPTRASEKRYSSFTLGFLLDNRDALVRAFGEARYRNWVLRRVRPADIKPLLLRDRSPQKIKA